jgi:hypothetical protein
MPLFILGSFGQRLYCENFATCSRIPPCLVVVPYSDYGVE